MRSNVFKMVILSIALGLSAGAGAVEFTESFGNFITNHAAIWGFVYYPAPAAATIAPPGTVVPDTLYLLDWTYAKSSSGYGSTGQAYLGVLTWDGNLNNSDIVGISATTVDMAAAPTAYPDSLMTWEFDNLPIQKSSQYLIVWLVPAEGGGWNIVSGAVEMGTGNELPGGVVQIGSSTMNQPGWDPHYRATYSDVTPYPVYTAPADGADNQTTNVQLSWTAPTAYTPIGYTVYVDPYEPNLTTTDATYYSYNQLGTTFTPDPALENDMTYYWRVEALEPNIAGPNPIPHSGPVYTFTTVALEVVITADPVSRTVDAGTEVILAVEALNATSYQWYKDDVLLTGETSNTLVIADMQVENEGFYYCVADNALNNPATSAAAQLMTRRLAGWWKLDGDLTDSVAAVVSGAPSHDGTSVDPNFVAIAKDGSGYEFDGLADSLVTITNSNAFFNFYPQGYTVSAWVNMPEKATTDPWGAFIAKQGFNPSRGFILTNNNIGNAVHTLRQSFGDLYSGFSADTGSWHLITGSYDAATGTGKIYFDGMLRNQAASAGIPQPSEAPLIFGAENADATTAPYRGLLDDVRIWTYPLDAYEIADLYTQFNPGQWLCVEQPAMDTTGPDGVPDCKVNLYEFAEIAAKWLECGRYPESDCN